MAANHLFFHLLILLAVFTVCRSLNSLRRQGLRDQDQQSGGMGRADGPGIQLLREGIDIFSGRGPCLTGPVCAMNLTSDGTGSGHGWYCNYVEVTTTGIHQQCAQERFTVEQWLATDTSPYELTAIRNYCSSEKKNRVVDGSDSSLLSVM
ncbi:UNVERIFIED_CONTAM: PLAT domain-containing protein 1 [Sesamum radiatum]|uniref:PLAT domain-containing protein 1 n=1 Tax=Sesamum radiatum TaxID=300843 RepID=A0AAW2P4N0_SESRA